MSLNVLANGRPRRPPVGSGYRNGLLQLGWPHFWLLIGILGGMLALAAVVMSAYLSSI